MAVSRTEIGAAPTRIDPGAEAITLENLGKRPLRFVVGEAANEAAPTDIDAGHLLKPGRRETVRLGADTYPIWAWAPHSTRIGVSAVLAG